MTLEQVKIGTRVRCLNDFADVPCCTQGVIDEDYGTGFMVAWDLPEQPLPPGYQQHNGRPAIQHGLLRDGFDKATELHLLGIVV